MPKASLLVLLLVVLSLSHADPNATNTTNTTLPPTLPPTLLPTTLPTILPTSAPTPIPHLLNNGSCWEDLVLLKKAQYINESISLQMLFSTGAGPNEFGNWDQCQDIGAQYAQFCAIAGDMTYLGQNLSVKLGACVPASCSEAFMIYLGDKLLFMTAGDIPPIENLFVRCPNQHPSPPLSSSGGAVVLVVIMVFCGVFCAAGTLLAYFEEEQIKKEAASLSAVNVNADHTTNGDESAPFLAHAKPRRKAKWEVFLQCFAIQSNLSFLTNDKHATGAFAMLNGLRVVMMVWVILGHTPYFEFYSLGYDNILHVYKYLYYDTFSFQVFPAAEYAVDVFYFLSAFLVTYLTYEEVKAARRPINWPYYYIHRFWRLTPVYMFVLVMSFKLAPFIGRGPFYFVEEQYFDRCDKYWWTNLLYINNLYPHDYRESCMGWAWYLANDMQFFCLVPIFLFLYKVSRKAFWASMLVLTALVLFLNGFLMAKFYDSLGPLNTLEEKIYAKPYTRIAPYFLGMALAFMVADHKGLTHSIYKKVYTRWFLYALSFTMTFLATYSTYEQNQWGKWKYVWYQAFSHYVFTFGLAIWVLSCFAGYGGIINWFLTASFWNPFAKLTYCAYLIHPLIMQTLYASQTRPMHYDWFELGYSFIGNLGYAYSLALVLYLVLEKPCANLERLLRGGGGHGHKK